MGEEKKYIRERSNSILEVIMAYARLEFNVQTEISEKGDASPRKKQPSDCFKFDEFASCKHYRSGFSGTDP